MDQDKLWDYYQVEDEGDTFSASSARYSYLVRQIGANESVLNIGVGRGGLERLLVSKTGAIASLDPSERAIEALNEELALGDRARVGRSQTIPFGDDEFDVVVMSEVLEHLTDDVIEATMGEVRRVLKPRTGRFIGTVPADEDLANEQCFCPKCGEKFHRWGHVQSFSRERLSATLTSHFEVGAIERQHFADIADLNWKGKSMVLIKKLLMTLNVPGKNENFFFAAIAR